MSWFFFSAAAAVAVVLGAWQVRQAGLSLARAAWTVVLAVGVGMVVGHWVALAFMPERVAERPELLLLLNEGGFSSFGVYGGAVLGAWAATGGRFWQYADRLAPGLLVAAALARAACLWHGCDFGRPAQIVWAWRYGPGTPAFRHHAQLGLIDPHASAALPTHLFPLYESVPVFVVGVAALALPRMFGAEPGRRAAGCAAAYCAIRAVAEHWRGDAAPTLGVTTMQLMCLGGLVVALLFFRGLTNETDPPVARSDRRGPHHRAHRLPGLRG